MPDDKLKPADEAAPGEPQTAENLCPTCSGTGRAGGDECPHCRGTGTITALVGDA
jgi:DnaJ-class molecular chaperone